MAGIYGVIDPGAERALEALAGEMAARLAHHPWYQRHGYGDTAAGVALGRVSLGFVNAAAQPAFNEDQSLAAVMDGEVYDYAALRRGLEKAGHRFAGAGHAELLLHGYEESGPEFFRGLAGRFAAALWDAPRRRLVLVNDRFGMRPLYYARRGGRFLFASELKALLADPGVSRAVSPRGLAQFFTFGQNFGEDTLYEAVRLLPAAAWVTYEPDTGHLAAGRYARLGESWAPRPLPRAEHLERIDAAFKRSVDRCTAGDARLGLSLSGGLDARTLLGAIDPERPVTTVCMGMEGSIDHRSAERMAALAGRPHHRHVLDTKFLDRFAEHLRHMVHLTDGQYLCQCIVMPTLPLYRRLGIQVLLRGHAGELMHMTKAYNFSLNRRVLGYDAPALEAWLSRRLRAYMVEGVEGALFTPAYQAHLESHARESLRDCLKESEGIDPPAHRVWHLFISQRLRRETALSMVEFGSVAETRLPYLDGDLIDALMAAPPDLKLADEIQTFILRKRMPAFLDVVNANTGARMGAGRLGLLLAKARLKLFAKLGVKGYQPYERLGLWLRRELRATVEGILLDDRCLGRGVFDPATLRRVVADHLAGRRNHTFLILAMMIFEQGRREFADGEPYVPPADPANGAADRAAPAAALTR
ncbi:MAG TPA: asparagine synthase-related protein [Gemmataceae bacterium]